MKLFLPLIVAFAALFPNPHPAIPLVSKAFDTCVGCSAAQDPSLATLQQIHADGYQLFAYDASTWGSGSTGVASCQYIPDENRVFDRALQAGLKVGIYTRNPICWQTVINHLKTDTNWSKIQFFVLDVEPASDGLPGSTVTRAEVNGVVAAGIRPVVYSSYWMWQEQMGSSTAFSDVPLWDAVDDGNVQPATFTPSLTAPAFTPYGGWSAATLRQDYNDATYGVTLDTVPADLDSVAASFLR